MSKPGRKPEVTDRDILEVFREAADPVLTTTEVADALPIGRRAVLGRLKKLRRDGALESKDVGPRGQVWWVADEEPTPDYSEGFGALAGAGFGEAVAQASEELDRGFRERENDLFGH